MPQASSSTNTATSNFQAIFQAALKAYEKKTKMDLLTHPLATQLKACKCAGDILSVLEDRAKEFEGADEGLSRWLNPTITVLYAFSAVLKGVGLVSPIQSTYLHPHYHFFSGIFSRNCDIRWY
jgi:hypothetical protein